MREALENIGAILLTGIGTILTGVIAILAKKAIDWVDKKTSFLDEERDIQRKAMLKYRVLETVRGACLETYQTFVSTLKESGNFTKEEADKAMELTKQRVMDRLTADGESLLVEMTGHTSVEKAVVSAVETELAEWKLFKNPL